MHDDYDEPDEPDMGLLEAKARAGDAESQYLYARELWLDAKTRAEFAEVYRWLRMAARQRHGDAWWKLAVCASSGDGCDAPDHEMAARLGLMGWRRTNAPHCATIAADALTELGQHEEAAAWYRVAAEAGDDDAMCSLGVAYRYGRGVARDYAQMIHWYVRAARAESVSAMWNLAICRRHGEGVRQDARAALWWDRRAADAGHATAAIRVAGAWIDGEVVPRQPARGVAELERLATEEENADAAHELGARLIAGNGLDVDVEDGLRWLGWAVDMGCVDAMTDLAVTYFNGDGVPSDYERAVELYRRAEKHGDSAATYNLGLCYEGGDGVDADEQRAWSLFDKAAERGHFGAVMRLARHHLSSGRGAKPSRAVELLRGIDEDDEPEALRLLADCLESGDGCDADPAAAAELRARADAFEAADDLT